jgi:coproporphyrinogen III oxidase-like Fe-S oxidoreductase
VRAWNVAAWAEYADRISAGQDPTAERERLTPVQRHLERLYLALRTRDGLADAELPAGSGPMVQKMRAQGWIESAHGRTRLTAQGWLRLDEIVRVLTTSAHGG